jgi:hypothetical protein
MSFSRKQSETDCSASRESHAHEKPYNYKDDPLYQFLAVTVRRGRRALTKEGRNKRLRARRANELDFRDRERARRYGITLEQLREMQERQNHACAICKRGGCELVLDHDHVTGEVRGLLCIPCNLILGLLRDDPHVARAAAEYLEGGARAMPATAPDSSAKAKPRTSVVIPADSGQAGESRNPVSTGPP